MRWMERASMMAAFSSSSITCPSRRNPWYLLAISAVLAMGME